MIDVVTQSLSRVQLCNPMDYSISGFPVLHYLLEFAQTYDAIQPFNHLILCHSLLLLPSIFPIIRVFSSELLLCIGWPKYWSFSLSISLSVDAEIWFQVRPVQESSEAPKPVATSVLATVATAASAQTWYEK